MHDRFQAVVLCPWEAPSTGSSVQADSFLCETEKHPTSLAAGELPIYRLSSTSRPLEGAGSPVIGTGQLVASFLSNSVPSDPGLLLTASPRTEKPLECSFQGKPVQGVHLES